MIRDVAKTREYAVSSSIGVAATRGDVFLCDLFVEACGAGAWSITLCSSAIGRQRLPVLFLRNGGLKLSLCRRQRWFPHRSRSCRCLRCFLFAQACFVAKCRCLTVKTGAKDLSSAQEFLCISRFWQSLARVLLPRSKSTLAVGAFKGTCILKLSYYC